VFDDEDETRLHAGVQTRGCSTFGEQRPTSHANRNRVEDLPLDVAELAGGGQRCRPSIEDWIQGSGTECVSNDLSGRSGGGDRAAAP
jgi:hypothetical protein